MSFVVSFLTILALVSLSAEKVLEKKKKLLISLKKITAV